jgi:hypothetical protein
MQTLGLSSESTRSDGRLKSIFWPSVENAWDVDYLGQQGMWICTAVAAMSLLASLISGNVVLVAVGLLMALFYWMGGMGVRQANWPAAVAVFLVYAINLSILGLRIFSPTGLLQLVFGLVLLSNVRAAVLASEWKPVEGDTDRPARFSETLADKYVDKMPAKLWPKLQIPFLILPIVMLLFSLLGAAFIAVQRLGLMPHPKTASNRAETRVHRLEIGPAFIDQAGGRSYNPDSSC